MRSLSGEIRSSEKNDDDNIPVTAHSEVPVRVSIHAISVVDDAANKRVSSMYRTGVDEIANYIYSVEHF